MTDEAPAPLVVPVRARDPRSSPTAAKRRVAELGTELRFRRSLKIGHPTTIGWVITVQNWAQIRYLYGSEGLSIRAIDRCPSWNCFGGAPADSGEVELADDEGLAALVPRSIGASGWLSFSDAGAASGQQWGETVGVLAE